MMVLTTFVFKSKDNSSYSNNHLVNTRRFNLFEPETSKLLKFNHKESVRIFIICAQPSISFVVIIGIFTIENV